MSTISSEGLAQEQRVLADLSTNNLARLQARGVTAEKLQQYAQLVAVMEQKRAAAEQSYSAKEQLTTQEADMRKDVLSIIRRIQEGVKKSFPGGSSQWKEFHIGENYNGTTSSIVAWAKDVAAAWVKYKDTLTSKSGIIQADIDGLSGAAAALESIDTQQEVAKTKAGPEATAAYKSAMKDVENMADMILTAAAAEFRKEPETAKPFERAKRLRYEAPSRKKETQPAQQPAAQPPVQA